MKPIEIFKSLPIEGKIAFGLTALIIINLPFVIMADNGLYHKITWAVNVINWFFMWRFFVKARAQRKKVVDLKNKIDRLREGLEEQLRGKWNQHYKDNE